MKQFLFITIFIISSTTFFAQILPANRYFNNHILDSESSNPSFAYSLRKLRIGYLGFAVKIRRGTDNAEANVQFDDFDRVSNSSIVTVTNTGTSTLSLGQNLTYNTFAGAQTISITIWYDQSTNAYDAIQTTNSKQPTLLLNSAGPSNTLPSVNFNPVNSQELIINQPIENLITSGINGSVLTICKGSNKTKQVLEQEWQTVGDGVQILTGQMEIAILMQQKFAVVLQEHSTIQLIMVYINNTLL